MGKKNPFFVETKKLPDGSILHLVNIEDISGDLEVLIDESLPSIHSGGDYNLNHTKQMLRGTFNTSQKPYDVPDVKMGAIAEFFVHLYFTNAGFKQECLLQNLEELNGIKKGFDGYYSFNGEEWLMESKSSRTNFEHKNTLKKAYDDLSDKVSGKNKDNRGNPISPWDNALKHAKQVKSNDSILEEIKKLSIDFLDKKFYTIADFNIIPSSTIFLNNTEESIENEKTHLDVTNYMSGKAYKKLHIVCVSQKTIDAFLDYLNK